MTTLNVHDTSELICNLEAIPKESRKTHQETAHYLITEARLEIKELTDGYAFKFPATAYGRITEYIANERLCCPFLTFEVIISADQGPIWLYLRGDEHIKAFLSAAIT
jgi:hypothetical protein